MINSKANKKIKFYKKLINNNSFSKKEKLFVVEGNNLIDECIKANIVQEILTTEIKKKNKQNHVLVDRTMISYLSNLETPQKEIALVKFPEFDKKEFTNLLYLDRIQDPGNLGTIIRTALAFSVDKILLSDECAYHFSSKVIRSSLGGIFKIPIQTRANISNFKDEYKIISSTLSKDSIDVNKFSIDKETKKIIVIGNEGSGISKKILNLSDYKIKININNIESLNASIACGIILHKLLS